MPVGRRDILYTLDTAAMFWISRNAAGNMGERKGIAVSAQHVNEMMPDILFVLGTAVPSTTAVWTAIEELCSGCDMSYNNASFMRLQEAHVLQMLVQKNTSSKVDFFLF